MNLTLIFARATLITFLLIASSWSFAQSIDEYRQQVASLMADFRWDEALRVASMGLEKSPTDSGLLVAAGALSMKIGKTSESARFVSRALEQPQTEPALLGVLGDLRLAGGDSASAVSLYKRALEGGSDQALLRYQLARALAKGGREEEALEQSARAVELDNRNPKYRRLYASLLDLTGQPAEAVLELKHARALAPQDARILLRLSDKQRHLGHPGRAIEFLEMAREVDPENPLYPSILAELYQELGVATEAETASRTAARLEGAFELYMEALELVSEGRPSEATPLLEQAANEAPEFMTGKLLLAHLYRKVGQTEKAVELYDQILERQPSSPHVAQELAWMYVTRGDLGSAVALLEAPSQRRDNLYLLEGYRKQLADDWEGAISEFMKVESAYPLDTSVLLQLSLSLSSVGRPEDALRYLEKAYSVNPGDAEIEKAARGVRFEHAIRLENQGRWEDALQLLDRLCLEEEKAEYLFHKAYAEQNLGRFRQAVEDYQNGLRLVPDAFWARINLAVCLDAIFLYHEATEQWKYLVSQDPQPQHLYGLGVSLIRYWRLKEGWSLVKQAAAGGHQPAERLLERRRR